MADSLFLIDGAEYPIPGLDSFNMAEARILYDCCGLGLEDFAVDEEDPDAMEELREKVKHPGYIEAMVMVAYMRGNPGITKKKAAAAAENMNLMEAYIAFIESGGEEDPTPAPESDPTDESSSGNGSGSGDDSSKSSDQPDENPESTGTGE